MRFLIAFLVVVTASPALFAQEQKKQNVRPELRKGNKLYQEKKYKEAQTAYLGALKKDPTSYTGIFNLGDALYHDKNYEQARQAMETGVKTTRDKKEQARAYHNIGNTFLQEKKWEEAAHAYKQSLRLDPTDADTKYNLAYANAMIKKDGGGKDKNKDKDKKDQDKKDQDKKDQDKKDQDKKDQDKKDGDQDKKDQDKKDGDQDKQKDQGDQDKDKQDQQRPQGQPSKLSQQQAENLLNALRQEEKKLQDKKEKGKGVPVKLDKDW